jgi:hypothetical protein
MTVFGLDDGVFVVFGTLVLMESETRTQERRARCMRLILGTRFQPSPFRCCPLAFEYCNSNAKLLSLRSDTLLGCYLGKFCFQHRVLMSSAFGD